MRRCLATGWGLIFGSLLAPQVQAQATPPAPSRKLNVKFDVVPVVAGGYHVSAEKLWGAAHRQALVVTPQLYHGAVAAFTSTLSEGGHDRVRGYGLEVQHRIYLNERTTPLEGFYVSYGPHYQHFELRFQSRSWQPEPAPNSLTYYEYRLRDQTETIDRYGAAAVVGGQFFLPNSAVFLDGYIGVGLRKASSRATLPGNRYARGMSDYGYEGHYLPLGFRVGVAW